MKETSKGKVKGKREAVVRGMRSRGFIIEGETIVMVMREEWREKRMRGRLIA